MKLSMMLLSLSFPVFMGDDFQPKAQAEISEYEAIVKIAAEAGYKAVDVSCMEISMFGEGAVKALLDKYGLSCACIIMFNDFTCLEKETQERVAAEGKAVVDIAVEWGCPVVMLVAAGVTPGQSRVENRQGLVENFTEICTYGVDKNIQVCVEDFPSTEVPMCSIAEMDDLLDHVPGLKLIYDNGNMLVAGEDPAEYFKHFADRIGYYHVKEVRVVDADEAVRLGVFGRPAGDLMGDGRYMVPALHGQGILDLAGLMKLAKASGYDGYMSVEYIPEPKGSGNHLANVRAARELLEGFISVEEDSHFYKW